MGNTPATTSQKRGGSKRVPCGDVFMGYVCHRTKGHDGLHKERVGSRVVSWRVGKLEVSR